MNKISIDYKYSVGDIVFIIDGNKVQQGVVNKITINTMTKELKSNSASKIIDGSLTINSDDYGFSDTVLSYSLELLNYKGFGGSRNMNKKESELFSSKEDLLNSL